MKERLTDLGHRLADLPGGRRAKWAVLAVWLILFFAMGPLAGKFEDAQENDPADYLPAKAESVKAIEELEDFPSGDIADAITVFNRDGGLEPSDEAAIEEVRTSINSSEFEEAGDTPPAIVSEDGSSALLITPITVQDGTNEAGEVLVDVTDEIKDDIEELPDGLEAKVTGPAGFSADAIAVFEQIDGALLYSTALLVLILLIIIYRSPIFWLIPFFSVILAEITSRGMGYLLAEAGVTVTGQTGGILPVLVFGAGTDYALLLVSRYREELRNYEDKHEAVRVAMRKASPAIFASGLTVMAALLTLTLAEVTGTVRARADLRPRRRHRDGRDAHDPAGAAGDHRAQGVLALHPARRDGRHRRDPRLLEPGRRLGREGPARVWIGTSLLLAVLCLGLTQLNSDLTSGNSFRGDVDSVEGQDLVEKAFPAGSNAPTNIVVTDESKLAAVQTAVEEAPGVSEIDRQARARPDGRQVRGHPRRGPA